MCFLLHRDMLLVVFLVWGQIIMLVASIAVSDFSFPFSLVRNTLDTYRHMLDSITNLVETLMSILESFLDKLCQSSVCFALNQNSLA